MSLIRLKENQFAPRCICGYDAIYFCDQAKGVSDCCNEPLCNDCVKKPPRWAESSLDAPIPENTRPSLDRHLCADHMKHTPENESKTFLDDFEGIYYGRN